ncbi:hypothetical protein [Cyanobium sp. NIES-981]|uniref:hypothetical protein n=1 Tax=Cyanobium sp. NIES-981 TaxID=1851505 RepID=UPI0007DCFB98|nr:hypothetical protein [Cyanobium sp. NIES-981]SBO44232.1 protein of unknown function [Cyanobium sp. NIES-981]
MKPLFRYFAKEDPWRDDLDGHHGRPYILARLGDGPGSEARWNQQRGCWEPFPDLIERLIGGDWWGEIPETRARLYFAAEAFEGGAIQPPQEEPHGQP